MFLSKILEIHNCFKFTSQYFVQNLISIVLTFKYFRNNNMLLQIRCCKTIFYNIVSNVKVIISRPMINHIVKKTFPRNVVGKGNNSFHIIIPAPTVLLFVSSIKINEPVFLLVLYESKNNGVVVLILIRAISFF